MELRIKRVWSLVVCKGGQEPLSVMSDENATEKSLNPICSRSKCLVGKDLVLFSILDRTTPPSGGNLKGGRIKQGHIRILGSVCRKKTNNRDCQYGRTGVRAWEIEVSDYFGIDLVRFQRSHAEECSSSKLRLRKGIG